MSQQTKKRGVLAREPASQQPESQETTSQNAEEPASQQAESQEPTSIKKIQARKTNLVTSKTGSAKVQKKRGRA